MITFEHGDVLHGGVLSLTLAYRCLVYESYGSTSRYHFLSLGHDTLEEPTLESIARSCA